jgi:sortase A
MRNRLAALLMVIGIGLLGYCAYVLIEAKLFQATEDREFTASLHAPPAARPSLPNPEKGSVLGKLEIPRLGLSVMVVEGDSHGDLKRAAGHIPNTALPGKPGNTGIAAHRDTYFRPLQGIKAGDAITVQTLEGTYQYRVTSTKIVNPTDNEVLFPTPRESLTLVTCYPFYYIGPAPKRFVVLAEREKSSPGL